MKLKLLALGMAASLGMAGTSLAQETNSRFVSTKKGSLLGFSANLTDFSASLPEVGKVDFGGSLMYWQGLTNHLDLSVRYNTLFSDYIKGTNIRPNLNWYHELEASLHLRLLNDAHLFNPFITAGIGVGNYNISDNERAFVPYAPVGLGIQMNINSHAYVFLQGNYRFSFDDKKLDNNTFYSLGFAQTICYAKPSTPPTPPPPPDQDGDGVPDSIDECPTQPGSAALNGCPDRDGDGIPDKDDKCPDQKGVAKYFGCPIPDTDGDGINDEEDKCPNVPGVAKYFGCPIPDTDGDGVNDEEDKCPTIPGPRSNRGCPEVREEVKKRLSFAATAIQFETGKATIKKTSHKLLDEIVDIMNEYTDYDMTISGHTDNTGKADRNQILSEERAASVKSYLESKGISASRLSSKGFGQDQPVADNKTAAGRAKNRRVEMDLKLKD